MTPPAGPATAEEGLRPGGRWERILTALSREPLTIGQLPAATDPGSHSKGRERAKIRRAIMAMADLGWVKCQNPWGWIATRQGVEALRAIAHAQPARAA